jgi:ABC-type glutathione transport system ATPase component
MGTPLLEVANLRVVFGSYGAESRVLDGIDLVVEEGTVLGLVAESGGGKSVLASAVLGLLPLGARVESGAIRLRGEDLVAL